MMDNQIITILDNNLIKCKENLFKCLKQLEIHHLQ